MSIYFTGTQARRIEKTVLDIVKNYLTTKINATPYADDFTAWNGVGIADANDDPTDYIATGKPFVFMNISNGDHQRFTWRKNINGVCKFGHRHDITIMFELAVTTRCFPALQLMRDAVQDIFAQGYFELDALGIQEAEITPQGSNHAEDQDLFPHRLNFQVYTLKE